MSMVSQGLDLAALIHPQRDDLNGVVHAAVRTAQSLDEPGATRFDEVYADIPPFPLDRLWLQHGVLTLLKNAAEASGGAGTIAIRTAWRSAKSVEVSATDTGPGLDPKALDTLFSPLGTVKGRNGSGLGLLLCQESVAAHRGRIEVASAPGHGTTFRIVLPTGLDGGLA